MVAIQSIQEWVTLTQSLEPTLLHLIQQQVHQVQPLVVLVLTVGTITASQTGSGSFSYAQSWTIGDIAGTGSEHTDFGNVTTHAAGTAMSSAAAPGTVTNAHVTTIAGNGTAGSTATSQFVTEITAF